MRNASQWYEQRQDELAKQRAELAQKESKEVTEQDTLNLEHESINEEKNTPVKEPEVGFFMPIILQSFSFIERKSPKVYYEYC